MDKGLRGIKKKKKRESVVRICLDRSEAGRQNGDEAEDAEEAGILSAGNIWLPQRGSLPGWKAGGRGPQDLCTSRMVTPEALSRATSSFRVNSSLKVEKTFANLRRYELALLSGDASGEDRRTESLSSVRPSVSQQGSGACLSVTTATAQLQPLAVQNQEKRQTEKKHPTGRRKVAWRTKGDFVGGGEGGGVESRTEKKNRTVRYVAHASRPLVFFLVFFPQRLRRVERINRNQRA